MNYEMLKGNASSYGCPYRDWDWHDGGPDFKCLAQGKNVCCVDSYSDFYHDAKNCEFLRSELKIMTTGPDDEKEEEWDAQLDRVDSIIEPPTPWEPRQLIEWLYITETEIEKQRPKLEVDHTDYYTGA